MRYLEKTFFAIIKEIKKNHSLSLFFQKNKKLIVTVSGGQDSILLLFFVAYNNQKYHYQIKTVFCNHLFQLDSFYSCSHIFRITYFLEIPNCFCLSENNLSNEETARNWRIKSFIRINSFSENGILFTGHTLNDKIETFLFNLFRGTSIDGLVSFSQKTVKTQKPTKSFFTFSFNFKRKKTFLEINRKLFLLRINKLKKTYYLNSLKKGIFRQKIFCKKKITLEKNEYFRPLIGIRRLETKKGCQSNLLPVYPDKTNKSLIYSRNRLRYQLVPTLRFFFNPKIDYILARLMSFNHLEKKYFFFLIEKILVENSFKNRNFNYLDTSIFFPLPLFLQRRILKTFLEKSLLKKINFLQVNLLLIQIKNTQPQQKNSLFIYPKIGIIFFKNNFLIVKKIY